MPEIILDTILHQRDSHYNNNRQDKNSRSQHLGPRDKVESSSDDKVDVGPSDRDLLPEIFEKEVVPAVFCGGDGVAAGGEELVLLGVEIAVGRV